MSVLLEEGLEPAGKGLHHERLRRVANIWTYKTKATVLISNPANQQTPPITHSNGTFLRSTQEQISSNYIKREDQDIVLLKGDCLTSSAAEP